MSCDKGRGDHIRKNPPQLPPRPRQFTVAAGSESAFAREGTGMGGCGAGGEWMVVDTWRMYTRRMPDTANSENEDVRECGHGYSSELRVSVQMKKKGRELAPATTTSLRLLAWRLEDVTLDLPCRSV